MKTKLFWEKFEDNDLDPLPVKLTLSSTQQNVQPDAGRMKSVVVDLCVGPRDQFFLTDNDPELPWMADVVWEIEGGDFDGEFLIQVTGSSDKPDLPFEDEMTGLRFWQVKLDLA